MNPTIPALALVVALAAAGCIAGPDVTNTAGVSRGESAEASVAIADAYPDAPVRVANSVGGTDQSSKTIDIPVGTAELVVKAAYRVGGTAQFTLSNTVMLPQKQDQITGSKEVWDEAWFVVENPIPGPWKFNLNVAGGAEYAFGFYY